MTSVRPQENLNPSDIAREQFNIAADLLKLDEGMRAVLSVPKRQTAAARAESASIRICYLRESSRD